MKSVKPEIKPRRIPATRFTRENHADKIPYPFVFNSGVSFVKNLLPGWRVVGWAPNNSLTTDIMRLDDKAGEYIAIMFTDSEGFDQWFHFGNYEYRFIES